MSGMAEKMYETSKEFLKHPRKSMQQVKNEATGAAAGIKAKQEFVDEYKRGTEAPASEGKQTPAKTYAMDRVNPNYKSGDTEKYIQGIAEKENARKQKIKTATGHRTGKKRAVKREMKR